MPKGYKVVKRYVDNKYYSSIIRPEYGGVEYKIGEKTKPQSKCGPLCVFNIIEEAIIFKRRYRGSKIFSCEYNLSRSKSIWGLAVPDYLIYHLERLPYGTVLASSVTLLKEVISPEELK